MKAVFLLLSLFGSLNVFGLPTSFITRMRSLVPTAVEKNQNAESLNFDWDGDSKNDTISYFCASPNKSGCAELTLGIALGNGRNYAFGGKRLFPGKQTRALLGHPLSLISTDVLKKLGCKNIKSIRLAVLIDGGPAESTLALYWNGQPETCSFERPSSILEDSEEQRPLWIGKIREQLVKQGIDIRKLTIQDFGSAKAAGPTLVDDADGDLRSELVFFFSNTKNEMGVGVWLSSNDRIELWGAGQKPLPPSWKSATLSADTGPNYPNVTELRDPEIKCPLNGVPEKYELHAIELKILAPEEGRGFLFWWKGELRACADFRAG